MFRGEKLSLKFGHFKMGLMMISKFCFCLFLCLFVCFCVFLCKNVNAIEFEKMSRSDYYDLLVQLKVGDANTF